MPEVQQRNCGHQHSQLAELPGLCVHELESPLCIQFDCHLQFPIPELHQECATEVLHLPDSAVCDTMFYHISSSLHRLINIGIRLPSPCSTPRLTITLH